MNENAKAWLAALRSGEYKQTTGTLKQTDSPGQCSYCCMGVACDLFATAHPEIARWSKSDKFRAFGLLGNSNINDAPFSVLNWLGIIPSQQDLAINLNDIEKKSFTEIADAIEKELNK